MTTIITARPAAGRSVAADSFSDLTTIPVASVSWAGGGFVSVEFAGDLTDAEVMSVQMRLMSSGPDEEATRCAAVDLLAAPVIDVPEVTRLLARIVLGLDQRPPNPEES